MPLLNTTDIWLFLKVIGFVRDASDLWVEYEWLTQALSML